LIIRILYHIIPIIAIERKQNVSTAIHTFSAVKVLKQLNTDVENGLTEVDAEERLKQGGPNQLQSAKRRSMFLRILDQFKDFLVIILIVAAIVSVVFGDGLKDAIIIIAIVVLNMIIGITQENRADNALRELKNMSTPKAKVIRDGQVVKIDSSKVVIGDIIVIDAGDCIPADIRLLESINLRIDESSLTGESISVLKKPM